MPDVLKQERIMGNAFDKPRPKSGATEVAVQIG